MALGAIFSLIIARTICNLLVATARFEAARCSFSPDSAGGGGGGNGTAPMGGVSQLVVWVLYSRA